MRYLQKKIDKEREDKEPEESLMNIRKLDATFNEVTDLLRKAVEYYIAVGKDLKSSDEKYKELIAEIDRDFALWEDNPLKPRLWNSPLYYMLKEWSDKSKRNLEQSRGCLTETKDALEVIGKALNAISKKLERVDEEVRLREERIEYLEDKLVLKEMMVKA